MEASMARCLRMRPTTLLSRPTVVRPTRTGLRYSSTENPSENNPLNPQPKTENQHRRQPWQSRTSTSTPESSESKPPQKTEFDDVLGKLDFQYKPLRRNREYVNPTGGWADRNNQDLASEIDLEQNSTRARRFENRPARVEFKLGPELGRQVVVEPEKGYNLNTALKQLQMNCSSNRVRVQRTAQKVHVRRGQKLKDLRSQRWRKLFMFSFKKTVEKANRMNRQGW